MRIHNHTIDQSIDISKYKIRNYINEHKSELKDTEEKHLDQKAALEKKIKELSKQVDKMKEERGLLKQNILDKEIQIAELTEIDNRFEVLRSMGNLLNNLNLVITETTDEQKKQAYALNNISTIMNLTKTFDNKPAVSEVCVQSD